MPYCFTRCSFKFQGHVMGQKFADFDPNWTFPNCNSCQNTPMAMKCSTKLEVALERCPIVFQGRVPTGPYFLEKSFAKLQ